MAKNLPVSRLINVDVILAPAAARAQDLSTLLILVNSPVIDVTERIREYTTLDQVSADFGTAAVAYLAANLWFQQAPQPFKLKIGRWAKTDTSGKLVCAPLAAVDQLITTWNAITNGSFKVNVDNSGLQSITGLNFSAASNLNGIASIINVALVGATCAYNSVYKRFEFTSNTSGVVSKVSFLTAGASGTDISDNLAGRVTDSGAYVADGIVAETAVAAATLFDSNFGQTWYALFMPEAVDAEHLTVAPYIQGSNNKHLYGVSTQEAGAISAVSTTDIAYLLKQLGYFRTIGQYSSSNPYAVVSALARQLTVDYNGQNTVITLMYKQEPGIVAESLTETEVNALEAKNFNVFVAYQNNTAILEPGKMVSGDYVDQITGTDWLSIEIMNEEFNLLYTSPTRIGQDDEGAHLMVTVAEAVCSRAVNNGLCAPGVWTSNGFGTLKTGDFMPKGFYVYAPPLANQSAADRAARKSVPIQVAAKLTGAVHTIDVQINVNR